MDLVFSRPRYVQGDPLDLVFGDTLEPPILPLTLQGTLYLEAPEATGTMLYDNRLPATVSTRIMARHQVAAPAQVQPVAPWGQPAPADQASASPWQSAGRADAAPVAPWDKTERADTPARTAWQAATPVAQQRGMVYQACTPLDVLSAIGWQLAAPATVNLLAPHQVADVLHQLRTVSAQQGAPISARAHAPHQVATPAQRAIRARWQVAAQLIPPGLTVLVPPGEGGITPHPVDLDLVFACPPYEPGAPINLVFGHVCVDDTIVVPVREVYVTINNYSLVRLDNGYVVPATQMTLGLDVDSWTWNVSFTVRGDVLPQIERDAAGNPVILQTSINSTPIRFAIEKIGRDRTFGSSQLRVQGRGIASELDAPFAPVMSFGNATARTAQQLLGDILTLNGVSIGWGFGTLGFTDWLVPAGVFSHQGTYISALNAVAGSIGAYVQPHNTLKQLDVLLRYPTPAWEWAAATPDIVLPSAVTTQEGIEWVDRPGYNRVFVSGQEGGILGRYTRAGTAGDVLAPQVVDPLITQAAAARQRGRAIISDTGRIANVTLRLPVLSETGIIKPGRMIQYTDGPTTRIGMSRSVSIDVALPTIYQTIMVETHVD